MKQDVIISIDIGGTTFESSILDKNYLNILDISNKWHVRDYQNSQELLILISALLRTLIWSFA